MSLSVSPVSRVNFCAGMQAAPVGESIDLGRAGAFTTPDGTDTVVIKDDAAPKKHTALKVIAGTVVGLAAIGFGLFAASKWGGKTFDATKSFEDIKKLEGFEKVKGYVTTAIGKAGAWIEKTCTGLFRSNKAQETVENAAENATAAAEGATTAAENAAAAAK